MVCSNCGALVDDGSAFCTQCGNAMPSNSASAAQNYDYGNEIMENEINAREYVSSVSSGFVFGVISLITSVTSFTLVGFICGIIAMIRNKKLPSVTEEYITDPMLLADYRAAKSKAKFSKTLGLAGTVISAIRYVGTVLFLVGYIVIIVLFAFFPMFGILIEEFI
jgi:hypothetical protein